MIKSTSKILDKISVNATAKTELLYLNVSGVGSSDSAALHRFRSLVALSTSLEVRGLTSVCHSGCLNLVGDWNVVEGQSNCPPRCSVY